MEADDVFENMKAMIEKCNKQGVAVNCISVTKKTFDLLMQSNNNRIQIIKKVTGTRRQSFKFKYKFMGADVNVIDA